MTRHRVSIWKTSITARQAGPRRWSMHIDIEGLDGDPRPVRTFRTRRAAVRAAERIMRRHARSKYRIRWGRISSNFYTGATDED